MLFPLGEAGYAGVMIYANIILTVTDEAEVPKVRDLLREHGRLSRAEPGCAGFDVFQSQTDSKVFVLCERWESQAALDVHRTAKGYMEIYKPQILPRSTRVAHLSDLIE
jgi:quinol monooxygenase YgiN